MIYVVLGLHFLFDWLLQPRVVARNKTTSLFYLGIHLATIYIGFSLFAFYVGVPNVWVLGYTVLHGIQDKIVWSFYVRYRKTYLEYNHYADDYWFYATIAVDQYLHLIPLIWIFENYYRVFQV